MNENEIFDHLLTDDEPDVNQDVQEQEDNSMDALLGIPKIDDSKLENEINGLSVNYNYNCIFSYLQT